MIRGGGGLVYETVNWQSFIAFNNSFGLPSVPTGAIIDASGGTAGGTITTGNVTQSFLTSPGTTVRFTATSHRPINCFD